MIKVWNACAENYMGDTIEYDLKWYQFKTTIVKCTKVHIKVLKFNLSQKKCWYVQQVCDAIRKT